MTKKSPSKPYKILLTNDDGVECPLFSSLLQELTLSDNFGEIISAVPAFEQSWISSAISRDKNIHVEEIKFNESRCFVINGTPADCVALTLSNLMDTKPDFVISGINLGVNAGSSFTHSSGTLAAAKYGALFDVPSIGLSTLVPPELRSAWSSRDMEKLNTYQSDLQRISKYQVKAVVSIINSGLISGANAVAHYASLNTPFNFEESKAPKVATPSDNRFGKMFTRTGEKSFVHSFSSFIEPENTKIANKQVEKSDLSLIYDNIPTCSFFRVDFAVGTSEYAEHAELELNKAFKEIS